MFIKTSQIKH